MIPVPTRTRVVASATASAYASESQYDSGMKTDSKPRASAVRAQPMISAGDASRSHRRA